MAGRRPDALFHPLYLGPRRGLDVNPYEPAPIKRSEPFGGPRRPVRDRPFHLEHLALELDVDVARGRIQGTATLSLRPLAAGLDRVELDAREMRIARVYLGRARGASRRRARHAHADGRLTVRLDRAYGPEETIVLAVEYAAQPRTGLWFVRPDGAYPERRAQAWSQGQAEDSAYWFPVFDHPNDKFPTEIKVTVDSQFRTVANGRLLSRKKSRDGARTTWHWRHEFPQPAYLVSLVVAPFVETRDRAAGVPLRFYAFAGQERAARRLYGKTGDMMRVFTKLFGPYPWKEYSQVVVSEYTWGGMENSGATTLTEKALLDARAAIDVSYEGLVSHELAHQWWGDLVTCRGWHHNWLNESWATFSENLYDEAAHGADSATWDRLQKYSQYVAQDLGQYRRPIVTDRYGIATDLFDRHAYEKGSLVLTILRDELGDEVFFRGARLYLDRHAQGFADTHEFRRALEEASGRDLNWFFDQWVFAAGYPEIRAQWRAVGRSGGVELELRQVQDTAASDLETTPLFRFHVEVEVEGTRGVRRHRIEVTRAKQKYTLACAGRPLRVAIDPSFRMLLRLDLVQPAASWRRALAKAAQFPERMRAARILAASPDRANFAALARALAKDRSPQVRMAAAIALAEAYGPRGKIGARNASAGAARKALERALLEDKDPHARRAAAFALGRFGVDGETALLEALDRERSYLVKATALKALALGGSSQLLAAASEAMGDRGWRDLVPMAALDALAIAKPPAAFDLAYASARYGETQEVREAAVRLLVALAKDAKASKARPEQARHVVRAIAELMKDPSVFLQLAAASAAGKLKDRKLIAPLKRLVREEAWDHLVDTAQKALKEFAPRKASPKKRARRA
ncbi:MAG: M1 family aminopeptidase [Candidatus Eisenbacteria bacterium]